MVQRDLIDAGLCDFCKFQKSMKSVSGETISVCRQSEIDLRFPKYPRLPVYHCVGYEEGRQAFREEELAGEPPGS
jgi:hypothetical protein